MLKELEKEQTPLDHAALIRRIERFRENLQPNDSLNVADWEELRSSIERSFTIQQLSDYIAEYKRPQVSAEEGLQDPRPSSSQSTATTWRPGTSQYVDTDATSSQPLADRVAKTHYLTGKLLLAERVLRDCWQLGVAGEIGQLDVWLPTHATTLLLRSDNFSFDELSELQEVTIDIMHDPGLIRITGNRRACESVRDIIQDAASRVVEETIGFPAAKPPSVAARVLIAGFLNWISETYRVVCQYEAHSGTVRVCYLSENKQKANDAIRTLSLALHAGQPAQVPYCTYVPTSQVASVYNAVLGDTASWFDKQHSWFRWALPSTQPAEETPRSVPAVGRYQTGLSDQLLKLLGCHSPTRAQPIGQLNNVQEHLVATVGKCLFRRNSSIDGSPLSLAELGELALPRTFLGDIPQVAAFLRLLAPFPYTENWVVYRIRLIPSPFGAQNMPSLEVEVERKRTTSIHGDELPFNIRSIQVKLAENSVDYLLPENGLDLRFTRLRYCELMKEPDIGQPFSQDVSFLESIRRCVSTLFEAARIRRERTPLGPFASIAWPKRLLQEISLRSKGRAGNVASSFLEDHNSEDVVPVDYVVPSLQGFRDSRLFSYGFRGERLNYSAYGSGSFASSRIADLYLDMTLTDTVPGVAGKLGFGNRSSTDLLSMEFNTFYNNACELALALDRTHVRPDASTLEMSTHRS